MIEPVRRVLEEPPLDGRQGDVIDARPLRKVGAVREGLLRKSFLRGGKHYDQALWSIVRADWYRSKAVWGSKAN